MEKIKGALKNRKTVVILICLFGIWLRLYNIGNLPAGLNQDEALAGYNAYSLLYYGIDSAGYHNPVYFVAWGSGMNALESYLMIPFVALFGLKSWVIRLPQAILACVSLPVFYLLLKRLFHEKMALTGLILLVICPWHIMLSRWGLESNLAPAFLLFGFYFFVRGVQDSSKWFLGAAVCYGLSLYCYATLWTVLPLLLLLQGIYCLCYKKISVRDGHLWLSILLLALMALPLLLFVMVNTGRIEEIRTGLFSIPRMAVFRSGEVSLDHISEKFVTTYSLVVSQNDGNVYNVIPQFGIYYLFSNVFVAIGFGILILNAVRGFRKREFSIKTLALIEIVVMFMIGLLTYVQVNRINALWLWLLLCIPVAIHEISEQVWKDFGKICLVVYGICFLAFGGYYYGGQFHTQIESGFSYNLEEAVLGATAMTDGTIYVESSVQYPVVLFYTKMPVEEFVETVEYRNAPAAYMDPFCYGRFVEYDFDVNSLGDGTYLLYSDHRQEVVDAGYAVSDYGRYIVAVRNRG